MHYRKAMRELCVSKTLEELKLMIDQKWHLFAQFKLDPPEMKGNMKVVRLSIVEDKTPLIPFVNFENMRNVKIQYPRYHVNKVKISTIKQISIQQWPNIKILVLNEGEVTERGSHDELIDQGGIYAELVKLQNVAKASNEF